MATSKIKKNEIVHGGFETSIEITNYTQADPFVAPSDGFARIIVAMAAGNAMMLYVDGQTVAGLSTPQNGAAIQNLTGSFPVFKGQRIYVSKTGTGTNRAYFNAYTT